MSANPIDPGVGIGHVHLKVADLERSLAFYCGVLGFQLMQRFGDQAAFISAGGYHHHIGLNTWESLGGSPPLSRRDSLSHTRGARRCPPSSERGGHPARRRRRSRRERGAISARSRPKRPRTLPGSPRSRKATHRRWPARHVLASAGLESPPQRPRILRAQFYCLARSEPYCLSTN